MSAEYFHQLQHGSQWGQPVFIKEVHGNVWKIGTINQPAREPDSCWVRFPDDSILRRTQPDDQTQVDYLLISNWRLRVKRGMCRNSVPPATQQRLQSMFSEHGTSSLTDRQSGCTSIAWTRGMSSERQNIPTSSSRFLWCDTTFHSSEEISLFYKGCSTQEILSFVRATVQSVKCLNCLDIWNTVEHSGRSFWALISSFSDYFMSDN